MEAASLPSRRNTRSELERRANRAMVSKSLGWTLSLCATRFRARHAALLHQIRSEGGQVSLLIALSAPTVSSFSLTPEVSRIFSELGITPEFELADD
jgi:hypothetical protein